MSTSGYGGVAREDEEEKQGAPAGIIGNRLVSTVEEQVRRLKVAVLEGRTELSMLGILGCLAMLVSVLLRLLLRMSR
jgi:hypothetical protein